MQNTLIETYFFEPLVPYGYEAPSQEVGKNDLTSEQIAQYIIQNPENLAIELPSILKRIDALNTVALILKELIENSDIVSEELISQCICQCICSLPSNIQYDLIEHHPLIFAQLIDYLNVQKRKELMRALAITLNDWKDSLMFVFNSLESNQSGKPPRDQPAGIFIVCLLGALPSRRKKQWIKYCCYELDFPKWAFFLICLEGQERSLALRASTSCFNYDLSEEGFLHCFQSLSLQMHHRTHVQEVVNKLLHKFYQAQAFEVLVDQFSDLSLNAQVCLLHVMTPSKQNLIFEKYHDNAWLMSAWLDELFLLRTEFSEKKGVLKRLCSALEGGLLPELLQMLNARNAKCGAYLLVCLSDELFQEFAFCIPCRVRSHLLNNSVADGTSSKLLRYLHDKEERKQLVYDVMGLDMENSAVPVEPDSSYTLKQCYELLVDLNAELASDYSPFIMRIPPLLIGFLSTKKKERKVLLKLAPFMSEEQLKFLISPLPANLFCSFADTTGPLLGSAKWIALLESLPPIKLIHYVRYKVAKLENVSAAFNQKYMELQRDFEQIEEGELLSVLQFETLQKQVIDLHTWSRQPATIDYHCLRRFLEDANNLKSFTSGNLESLQGLIIQLKATMSNLTARRQLFEGPHAPITAQMAIFSQYVDAEEEVEIDLTMTLYPGFWLLVREGTLPYLGISPHSELGITHAGQLTCLGIKSDQDLELLGISLNLQNKVDELISDIERMQPCQMGYPVCSSSMQVEPESLPSIKLLWQECLNIRISDAELRQLSERLILSLNISQINLTQFKEGCLNFCKKLLTFGHVSDMHQLLIQEQGDAFEKSETNEETASIGGKLLVEALIILRGQHPLFCLQRYLVCNSHLKQSWEKFREKGYHSIHDIVQNQIIKTSADLLRLEELAQ